MEVVSPSNAPQLLAAVVPNSIVPRASDQVTACGSQQGARWITPPPVRLSDGTRLQLFKDGEGLHAALAAIQSARELICLEVYIFASDAVGRAFAQLLCSKARQGVRAFVIYDSFGSLYADPRMFAAMRESGVHVQEFHPLLPWRTRHSWRPLNRDHRKLLVIDHQIAGLGGLNIGAEYAGSWVGSSRQEHCQAWRDNAIAIVGPSAVIFQNAFARSWDYVTHGGRIRRAEFSAHLRDAQLGVLASVPTTQSPVRPGLMRLVESARSRIDMTMAYFVPDDALIHQLCRAARRGVRVRLMLPGHCDVPLVRIAARSFYETLLGCGIEVYERQGVVLHAKSLVIDGSITLMGSTNLDYRSIEYNCEIATIIRREDLARQMHELFDYDVNFATKIELLEWRRRPLRDRLVQWGVSRARYWL